MKRIAFWLVMSLFCINAYAYDIDIDYTLTNQDTFSILIEYGEYCTLSGEKYKCKENKFEVGQMPFERWAEFFDAIKNDYKEVKEIFNLTFTINNKSFPSCSHLEKQGRTIKTTLTKQGCL